MINSIRILTVASALLSLSMPASAADGETVTLVSDDSKTNSLAIEMGESAKLLFSKSGVRIEGTTTIWGPGSGGPDFLVKLGEMSYLMTPVPGEQMVIAGPAVLMLRNRSANDGTVYRDLATFEVKKVGTASPPAEVPQEAGSNFDVVLEQSSDLVNWTPANPGTYSGTETKRFFRTRIVKKQ